MNWLHRLLNPHCEHCIEEARESRICHSCETLTRQLEIVQYEKKQLLNKILNTPEPGLVHEPIRPPEPITTKNVPWEVRKNQLEVLDREKALARQLQEERSREITQLMSKKSTEDLEKELGVSNG
jgi:hypothetical protein